MQPPPPPAATATQWKAKKVRLLPSPAQRELLKQWIGAARWTYNQCASAWIADNNVRSAKALRAHCLNSDAALVQQHAEWLTKVPYDVRDEGMRDFLKALKTTFELKKRGRIEHFKMRFRSKKLSHVETIVIHAKHWKTGNTWFKSFLGKKPLRSTEPLPDKLHADCRLQYNRRTNKWFVCLLEPIGDIVKKPSRKKRKETADDTKTVKKSSKKASKQTKETKTTKKQQQLKKRKRPEDECVQGWFVVTDNFISLILFPGKRRSHLLSFCLLHKTQRM